MTLAVNIAQSGSNNVTFRNRIINGAMVINQRGFSGTVTTDDTYTLDRWSARSSASSKFSVSQNAGSITPPVGLVNYLGVTSLSAYSVSSTDYFAISQIIEGYNVADLNFGSANAKTITLSFQVYSSLTGTFSGALLNDGRDRVYPFTYTISSANTWTTISVTLAGDISGTWTTTNGAGLYVRFCLGAGSTRLATAGSWQTTAGAIFGATGTTSVVGTSGATFYITGVQLEAGTTASPFEYRQYGTELQLCQRYYFQSANINDGTQFYAIHGYVASGGNVRWFFKIPVPMRTTPSIALNPVYNTGSSWQANLTGINNYAFTAAPSIGNYDGGLQLSISQNISAISASYYTFNVILYPTTSVNTNNFQISAEL